MKKQPHRRYELLLPRKFNDGRSVPQRLYTETFLELESQLEVFRLKRKPFEDDGGTKVESIVTS